MKWEPREKNGQVYDEVRLNLSNVTWKILVWNAPDGKIRRGWCWQVSKLDHHYSKFVVMGSGQSDDEARAKLRSLEVALEDHGA